MKSHELLKEIKALLTDNADIDTAAVDNEARIILSHLFSCGLNSVLLHQPSDKQAKQARRLAQSRRSGYPLQYVLGETYFMGRRFAVSPDVLIPRGDTEPMVEAILPLYKDRSDIKIADICCGSGAIGIILAEGLPKAQLYAADISPAALAVAKDNAQGVINITFLQGDLCEPLLPLAPFDLIVCNPPYVDEQEMLELQPEVRYEPSLALYGGRDGLDFYRRLSEYAPPLLKEGGRLVLEIGCKQNASVCALLKAGGLQIEHCLKDWGGNDRSIFAIKMF